MHNQRVGSKLPQWPVFITALLALSQHVSSLAIRPRADDAKLPSREDRTDSSVYEFVNEFNAADAKCKRADSWPPRCYPESEPASPAWYIAAGSPQAPPSPEVLEDMDPFERQAMLNSAIRDGRQLKNLLVNSLSSGTTRLDNYPWGKQDGLFRDNYKLHEPVAENYPLDKVLLNVNHAFDEANIKTSDGSGINADQGFTLALYDGKLAGGRSPAPRTIFEMAGSVKENIIVATWSDAEADETPFGQKAYSSTLMWNAWSEIAGDGARKLRAQLRHKVTNKQTLDIIALAHRKWTKNVHDTAFPPEEGFGTGTWKPEDSVNDHSNEGFLALISTPVLRSCIDMLVDRHLEMDNPYIKTIYTIPRWENGPDSRLKEADIVLEYGPLPVDATPAGASSSGASRWPMPGGEEFATA